jgi:hypothetical protein
VLLGLVPQKDGLCTARAFRQASIETPYRYW